MKDIVVISITLHIIVTMHSCHIFNHIIDTHELISNETLFCRHRML